MDGGAPASLWARAKALFTREPECEPQVEPQVEPEAPHEAVFRDALALHQQGRLPEAEQRYREVLSAQSGHAPALAFLGMLAYQAGRPAIAVDLLSRAVAIDPGQPGFHSNLALALNAAGRGRHALEACERAIGLDSKSVEAWSNRGIALWGLGRREEALASFASALAIDPGHAQTHWNEGFLRMQLGLFEAGWQKQEWRWKLDHTLADRREFPARLWLGQESLDGKTILLHAEQGLGDTIQFCRYAKLVAARGAKVILEVQKPLIGLLSKVEGASEVLARGEPLPSFDFHTPLLSLPLAFGTTLETIPAKRAYLECEPQEVASWRERLGERIAPRVGLVWKAAGAHKSIALERLLELATPGKEFFSLQNEVSAEEQTRLDSGGVRQLTAGLRNFSDAPLVDLMDLVITVDTSLAHLAAALGKPVWMLLPYNPEWRWLLEREDSPWYPTMRLFRQPAVDDWDSVLERVKAELAKSGPR